MNKILNINYITDTDKIKPDFNKFIKNIPFEKQNKYYKDLNKQIVKDIPDFIIKNNSDIILKANNLLNKYLNNTLKENNELNTWNICLTQDNFMFEFPFTLGSIIFMPLNYNNHMLKNDKHNLLITFIHEQIHIYQRYNLSNWNNTIQNHTNWKLCSFKTFNDMILNPDTFYKNYSYCYTLDNKQYYGYIGYNFDIIWIDINTNNKYTNEKLPKQEHPFEEYAYSLSTDIAKKIEK